VALGVLAAGCASIPELELYTTTCKGTEREGCFVGLRDCRNPRFCEEAGETDWFTHGDGLYITECRKEKPKRCRDVVKQTAVCLEDCELKQDAATRRPLL